MPGRAASIQDSAQILTKVDVRAVVASSLDWVKIARPIKEPAKSQSPKALAASPAERAPWLKSQTAPTAVVNSEA